VDSVKGRSPFEGGEFEVHKMEAFFYKI